MDHDPAAPWDKALAESLARQTSTPASPQSGQTARLHLERRKPYHLLNKSRDMAQIPDLLRSAIRAMVKGEKPWPLFIYGPAGTGKTCAVLCLLDFISDGDYYTASGLCETVIQSQAGRLEWYHEGYGGTLWPEKFWSKFAAKSLVVLDEIGTRDKVSDHHYECIKRVLDDRHGKPLILLSNLDLTTLARVYDDRIASRMAGGTVVKLDGPDMRLQR